MKTHLLLASMFILTASSFVANAQSRKYSHFRKAAPEVYIGPEFLAGTHSFSFKSDIDKIDGVRISQTGTSFGGMVGHRLLRARVRSGSFSSENYVNEKVKTKVMEGALNLFPLQLNSRRFRSFEPYGIVGISRNQYHLFGNYVGYPPPPAPKKAACTCPCLCGDVAVTVAKDDAVVTEPAPAPEPLPAGSDLGKIITREFFGGLGLEGHIQRNGFFIHLFGEVTYGGAKQVMVTNRSFINTNIATPMMMRVGISAGLNW